MQYKNANIANFVYNGKTRLEVEIKDTQVTKSCSIGSCKKISGIFQCLCKWKILIELNLFPKALLALPLCDKILVFMNNL